MLIHESCIGKSKAHIPPEPLPLTLQPGSQPHLAEATIRSQFPACPHHCKIKWFSKSPYYLNFLRCSPWLNFLCCRWVPYTFPQENAVAQGSVLCVSSQDLSIHLPLPVFIEFFFHLFPIAINPCGCFFPFPGLQCLPLCYDF